MNPSRMLPWRYHLPTERPIPDYLRPPFGGRLLFIHHQVDSWDIRNHFEILIPEAVQLNPQRDAMERDRLKLLQEFHKFLDDRRSWLFYNDPDTQHRETAKLLYHWLHQPSSLDKPYENRTIRL